MLLTNAALLSVAGSMVQTSEVVFGLGKLAITGDRKGIKNPLAIHVLM